MTWKAVGALGSLNAWFTKALSTLPCVNPVVSVNGAVSATSNAVLLVAVTILDIK